MENPVTYLIQNRYLADPRFVPITFESDAVVAEPEPGMDYHQLDLEDLGRDRNRTRHIIELAAHAVERHPRTIVFCPSVDSAQRCHSSLRDNRLEASIITASTPSEDRRAIVNAFKDDTRETHGDVQLWRSYRWV